MSTADRIIRVLIAVLIGGLYYFGQISGTAAIILGIIAVIFAATSFINFCPLYRVLGISTKALQK